MNAFKLAKTYANRKVEQLHSTIKPPIYEGSLKGAEETEEQHTIATEKEKKKLMAGAMSNHEHHPELKKKLPMEKPGHVGVSKHHLSGAANKGDIRRLLHGHRPARHHLLTYRTPEHRKEAP